MATDVALNIFSHRRSKDPSQMKIPQIRKPGTNEDNRSFDYI